MASAPNFLRGSTPRPGDPITSKNFADLANASTAARQTFTTEQYGVATAGGIVFFPTLPPRSSGPPGASVLHALNVSDVSSVSMGATALISVKAGSVTDTTNGGKVWTGATGNIIFINDWINGNVAFAVPAGGPPATYPALALSASATVVYLNATVDNTTGYITAMDIEGDMGAGLPASTTTNWYYLLSSVIVVFDPIAGTYSVTVLDDGAQSALNFGICGSVPLVNGSQYRVGT